MQLNLLVPVSRPWAIPTFFDYLNRSDVPKDARVFLVVDGDEGWQWVDAFKENGWNVAFAFQTPFDAPLSANDEEEVAYRRERHLEIRKLTQRILPDEGLVLALEDDTLVPPRLFASLSAVLRRPHAVAATGYQVSRHGFLRAAGVWRVEGKRYWTLAPGNRKVQAVDACGHYCLLTQSAYYRHASLELGPEPLDAVDRAHTYRLGHWGTIYVDWSCGCGHLLLPFYAIPPEVQHTLHCEEGKEPEVRKIPTPAGTFFEGFFPEEKMPHDEKVGDLQMDGEWYITQSQVVQDGVVIYGKGQRVPINEAILLGLVDPPANLKVKPQPAFNKDARQVKLEMKDEDFGEAGSKRRRHEEE